MGLKIGNVSRLTGVRIDTIRFYEKAGLLPEPERRDSGYRDYSKGTISRLLFIRKSKNLGFTRSEIREILDLRTDSPGNCHSVQDLATKKIESAKEKIRSLQQILSALILLVEECKDPKEPSPCPIIDFLDRSTPRPKEDGAQ